MRGYSTRFVWNSGRSTLNAPRRCKDTDSEEMFPGSSGANWCETLDVQIATADTERRLVVLHHGDLCTLEQGVHAQDGVVRLVKDCCDPRKLRLLPTVHEQSSWRRICEVPSAHGRAKLSRHGRGKLCRTWHVGVETTTPTNHAKANKTI